MSIVDWLKRLTGRRLDEEDFQEEIRAHLAIATDERMADGADRRSAQLASLKEFGNVTLTTEAARRIWTPWWIDVLHDLMSDVRYAVRGLAKNPAFSLTVVGVLTLGIGVNAASFTMLKGIALSPIAGVDRSARLAVIFGETGAGRQLGISYPDYVYLRDHDRAFTGLFGTSVAKVGLGRGRSARQIWAELVTGNVLSTPARRDPRRSRYRISHARRVPADGVSRYARAARDDRGLRPAPWRRSGVHVEHRRFGLLPDAAFR